LPLNFEVYYKRIQQNDILIIKFIILNCLLFELKIPELYSSFNKLNSRFLIFNMSLSDNTNQLAEHEVEIKKPVNYINDFSRLLEKFSKTAYANIKPLKQITQQLYKRITCHKIAWSTELGLNNAASTALTTGFLWYIKNNIYRNIKHNVKLTDKAPNLMVKPRFDNPCLNTYLMCIFTIRLGHIIFTGIKFIVLMASLLLKGGGQSE
jgi:hypothetical protein